MTEPAPKVVDWEHLPADIAVRSLWETLHDAELIGCVSNRLERTIRLSFDLSHLVEGEGELPCEVLLRDVTSARATVSVPWPGECGNTKGLSRAEESRVISEYQAKWREESLAWDDFEAALNEGSLWTLDAELAAGPDSQALRLEGTLEREEQEDRYGVVTIAFASFEMTVEGETTTLDAFDRLGAAHWESFRARRRTPIDPVEPES